MTFLKSIFLFLLLISFNGYSQNNVEIPNIISPNEDGINDVFFIRAPGYENLTCTILNRYGETVYRYYGLNGNWDAYTHAGEKVTAGTYFVYVELLKSDGTIETCQET